MPLGRCTRTSTRASDRVPDAYTTAIPTLFQRPPDFLAPWPSQALARSFVLVNRHADSISSIQYTVLQPVDQSVHLSRPEVRLRQDHRPLTSEPALRGGQPLAGRLGVALEQLQRLPEDPREAEKAIGLLRLEAALLLAPGQGARLDGDGLGEVAHRQAGDPLKPHERLKREALFDTPEDPYRVLGAESDERHVPIRVRPPPLDGLAVRLDLRWFRRRGFCERALHHAFPPPFGISYDARRLKSRAELPAHDERRHHPIGSGSEHDPHPPHAGHVGPVVLRLREGAGGEPEHGPDAGSHGRAPDAPAAERLLLIRIVASRAEDEAEGSQ